MAKSINRKSLSKETATDRFFRLGLALCDRHKVLYSGDKSLWFAIHSWNKYSNVNFYQYMEKCMKYDQIHKNHKRINEWQELLSKGLTVDEILGWAENHYKKEWNKLMADVDNQIKNKK